MKDKLKRVGINFSRPSPDSEIKRWLVHRICLLACSGKERESRFTTSLTRDEQVGPLEVTIGWEDCHVLWATIGFVWLALGPVRLKIQVEWYREDHGYQLYGSHVYLERRKRAAK